MRDLFFDSTHGKGKTLGHVWKYMVGKGWRRAVGGGNNMLVAVVQEHSQSVDGPSFSDHSPWIPLAPKLQQQPFEAR